MAWADFVSQSTTDSHKFSVDWQSAQIASLANRGAATMRVRDQLTSVGSTVGFFGPTPCTEGDGSAAARMMELLPSCSAIPFDERGDGAPIDGAFDGDRQHPNGVKLLPLLLRSKLGQYRGVAQQMYKTAVENNTFTIRAPDTASVQRLIYKVISMQSLSVCA